MSFTAMVGSCRLCRWSQLLLILGLLLPPDVLGSTSDKSNFIVGHFRAKADTTSPSSTLSLSPTPASPSASASSSISSEQPNQLQQPICALDRPNNSYSAVCSALRCSKVCLDRLGSNCLGINYNRITKNCDLFDRRPKCFAQVPGCVHYQENLINPGDTTDSEQSLQADSCSIPFTYNGQLFNGCTESLRSLGDCNLGCLLSNRSIATCRRTFPVDVAEFFWVNVTVPNVPGSTPLLSINQWIVMQQRIDDSIDFVQDWSSYRAGFGNSTMTSISRDGSVSSSSAAGNFWLGLEKMHQLTSTSTYRLRIELQSLYADNWFSAEYETFVIDSELLGYAIQLGMYVGDAGDAMNSQAYSGAVYHNGMKFSTIDQDNDQDKNDNCALLKGGGGWWYNGCLYCNLNNPYNNSRFYWLSLVDLGLASTAQLQTTRMMIKQL